jgi:hypothetical protein
MTGSRLHLLYVPILLLVTVAAAAAEPQDPPATEPAADDLTKRILEEEQDSELRVVGVSRVRLSFPQRISAGVGAMFSRQPTIYDCRTVCEFRGLFVQAEPGYSGGQLSIGYADIMGEKGDNEHFLTRVYLAWGVKAALLKSWNGADLTPSDQTLLGVEGDFTVIRINFSLGVFKHVGSGDPDEPWLLTGGVGWGF